MNVSAMMSKNFIRCFYPKKKTNKKQMSSQKYGIIQKQLLKTNPRAKVVLQKYWAVTFQTNHTSISILYIGKLYGEL